jgi:hypothetical protein
MTTRDGRRPAAKRSRRDGAFLALASFRRGRPVERQAMTLNNLQRKIVWGGLIAFAVIGLIPPWDYSYTADSFRGSDTGYFPVFLPPSSYYFNVTSQHVDFRRLFLQWFVLVAVVAAAAFLTKSPASPTDQATK